MYANRWLCSQEGPISRGACDCAFMQVRSGKHHGINFEEFKSALTLLADKAAVSASAHRALAFFP